MSMTDWAKREVELACARERKVNGTPEGEPDCGCLCYESALKAYNSLVEDGHSGMSIGFTKAILNALIDGKPLTPIEDAEDVWSKVEGTEEDGTIRYQCNRMFSLFKDVHPDGTVTYHDNNRLYCVDIHNPSNTWHNGFVRRIAEAVIPPITMPYSPGKPWAIGCEEFLVDPANGDFDTLGVFWITNGDETIQLEQYFVEDSSMEDGWRKISKTEYKQRKRRRVILL